MHDIVIRGGAIIDGTGKAAFTGDVAIAGDRIAAVGGKLGPARREIDAAGLLVTPGWVDVHTHYDGQAMWDPLLAPSCWHGVTTVMFGNCGVGFAPVKKHHRGALMDLMEGVEEIPNPVLSAGLTWEWETFPEFIGCTRASTSRHRHRRPSRASAPARLRHGRPRSAARTGDSGRHCRDAPLDDRGARGRCFRLHHLADRFAQDAGWRSGAVAYADADELVGIGSALGAVGGGAFGMNSDFDDEAYELAWLKRLARETKRPVWFLLTDRYDDPGRWRRLMKAVHEARAEGLPMTAQIAGRPIGVMMGIGTALNPFTVRPTYKQLESLPIDGQRMRLRDPNVRRQILAEQPSDAEVAKLAKFRQDVISSWDRFFVMEDPPDYEPPPEKSIAAMAARSGRPTDEVAYDYITEADGRYLYFPLVNYVTGDHAPIHEMMNDPACLLGLSDGGAHCTSIVDFGLPSFMLVHWGRDRRRGPRLPLEFLVKRQTSETADFFDLADRGRRTWPARRRQPDRLRRAAARHARTRSRHAGRWSPLCAARRWLCRDAQVARTTDLRAR